MAPAGEVSYPATVAQLQNETGFNYQTYCEVNGLDFPGQDAHARFNNISPTQVAALADMAEALATKRYVAAIAEQVEKSMQAASGAALYSLTNGQIPATQTEPSEAQPS